ncbi:3,4-dihydroxy-2-butanone 4-phosphate synthase [Psychrobacter sp. JCM 18900]|nr:3,4-dihydroxy-2-butanone 4-phosphate synthase [Psychrobacter sp. JCM 18900]
MQMVDFMNINTIPEIIEDIKAGKMVIIMDDEDRENEGDLIMAATLAKPDDINFMITHARGLVCLTLTSERCKKIKTTSHVQRQPSTL